MAKLTTGASFYEKHPAAAQVYGDDFDSTDLPPEKAGTRDDRRDMARMGKVQEFKVWLLS